MNSLGAFLERQRANAPAWRKALFAALALLVVANLFVNTHEPHFVIDAYPGCWAGFGLVVGLVMVGVMKRMVQPSIVRKEDYYGDL